MLKILKRKDERQDESREKGNVAVLEETPLGREMLEPVVEKEEDTAENADETEQVETEGEAQEDRSCGITVEFQMGQSLLPRVEAWIRNGLRRRWRSCRRRERLGAMEL